MPLSVWLQQEVVHNRNHQPRLVQQNLLIIININTEADIDKFLETYWNKFPHATVTPKLHMLEDHTIPFLKKWGVGLGFLGEHGAESIHARFNSLRRTFDKIPDPTIDGGKMLPSKGAVLKIVQKVR